MKRLARRSVRRRRINESKKQKWWFDIPGAKHIYHGDWNDPEIQYKGFSLNYWDVVDGAYEVWKEENPEGSEKDFDDWLDKQGGDGGWIQGELDNSVYACLGDNATEDEEWLGVPDAYKITGEIYGQGDGEYVLYKDCLVDISDLEYYDKDNDEYYRYDEDPQGFEGYYIAQRNRGELIDQLNYKIKDYFVSESRKYDESWIGDKAKAGWNKVKDGAKKVGKAIGDALNGPFRKGDHIILKGEDGDTFKGTIKSYDRGSQTYGVILGNPVSEDAFGD